MGVRATEHAEFETWIFCPEGAFCVGEAKKIDVRSTARVRVPCALATNQRILGNR